jgi:hypothetical protein
MFCRFIYNSHRFVCGAAQNSQTPINVIDRRVRVPTLFVRFALCSQQHVAYFYSNTDIVARIGLAASIRRRVRQQRSQQQ